MPVLRALANGGFQAQRGAISYRGKRPAKAGEGLGITVKAIARGRDGRSVPVAV